MNFLAPAFLAGLAAIAVPVIIHLINRERRVVVEFPSLMFLQRIPYRSVRRQKIRHLLLLILRCLALALLVAAFARPFFQRRHAAIATTGAREVVILLDRSCEHGLRRPVDQGARRGEEGRRADLGAGDRATLVLFAERRVRRDASRWRRPIAIIAAINAAKLERRRDALRARAQARVADRRARRSCRGARSC